MSIRIDYMYKERYKTTKFNDFVNFKVQKSCLSMTIYYHWYSYSESLCSFSKFSMPWELQFVLSHPIPSHGTFPMGFPWESHSHGQACESSIKAIFGESIRVWVRIGPSLHFSD
ncbi:unnamed protein product [Clavelina lepadiformis]|uniref:Uncharacterized protein n=1 Tax=Clavelina lepadiformis TaxID=159417 RepID=A0ABP0GUU6_CLALP